MKEISVTRLPSTYRVEIGSQKIWLTTDEIERLIECALMEIPGVHVLQEIWKRRTRHKLVIEQLWSAHDGIARPSSYRAKLMFGAEVAQVVERTDIDSLMLAIVQKFGIHESAEVPPIVDNAVSRKLAEIEAQEQVIKMFCERHGLTVEELLNKVQTGEVTEIAI